MNDYTLFYWPVPFRGQFVRAVLDHVHADWIEADVDDLLNLMDMEPADQPVPMMGPPAITDHAAGISLSQTAAILGYLGRKHELIPDDEARRALTDKILSDIDDVLFEMTRHNGEQMWTRAAWDDYLPRLGRWMDIFDVTGRRHGLKPDKGFLLGTEVCGLADLATATLWRTMTDCLPPLRSVLDERATLAGLCDRIASLPEQVALRERSKSDFGEVWCGGQIESSLRAALETRPECPARIGK